jgi:hypothetical protein
MVDETPVNLRDEELEDESWEVLRAAVILARMQRRI